MRYYDFVVSLAASMHNTGLFANSELVKFEETHTIITNHVVTFNFFFFFKTIDQ